MVILDCCKQPYWLTGHHRPQTSLPTRVTLSSFSRHTQPPYRIIAPNSQSHAQPTRRSPSPNCHCSCHYSTFEESRASRSPEAEQLHIYSTVSKAHSKRNDQLSVSKKPSPFQFGLKSMLSSATKSRVSPSRESNYCDITDLYEFTNVNSRRASCSKSTASGQQQYNHLYSGDSIDSHTRKRQYHNRNILCVVRINPFKSVMMEPLHVDNRLIVFSLVDSFTKLSPNKIFETFIKKLKDENHANITVFNLSEPLEYMRPSLDVPICEFGFPERHSLSLEKLCVLCKAIDSWLALDSTRNVAVIYSKRDLSRSSLAIAVFLQYVNVCLGRECTTFDLESMQKYYEQNLQQYLQPSQRRYIGYFRNLLSGESKINSQQFYLNCVVIQKVPNFDGNGLCKPFIKIYQGMSLIYSSPLLNLNAEYLKKYDYIVFHLDPPLKLRGEILVKCYHHRSSPSTRIAMLSFQFHTGTLKSDVTTFSKDEIDIASYDKRFHTNTQVKLMFNEAQLDHLPEVESFDDDLITKWNSYENFLVEDGNVEYTKGPLDGSLYATIPKRSFPQFHASQTYPTLTDEPKPNERQLDELLDELLLEIKSLPDLTVSSTEIQNENEPSPSAEKQPASEELTISITTNSAAASPSSETDFSLAPYETTDKTAEQNGQLTWLQKQQLKLKNKNVKQNQKHTYAEKQMIEQLKFTIQSQQQNVPLDDGEEISFVSPAIPTRTSSKNIFPLFAEQQILDQTISQTLPLRRVDSVQSNDSRNYMSLSQYSPISSVSLLRQAIKLESEASVGPDHIQNSGSQNKQAKTYEATSLSPAHRPVTPSFPVRDFRHSMLHTEDKDQELSATLPFFIKDTSAFWYKPHISREEAIKLLQDKESGAFIIRDSNSFHGAFGLALKVARKEDTSMPDSVRHFLIESTSKGVQIKGYPEEPVFSSLSALVYQHSITRISLPTALIIPSMDIETNENDENDSNLNRIYEYGAACNVIYFKSEDVESLTGDVAISKVIDNLLQLKASQIKPTVVHFKASNKGITLTDNSHKIFFRQHYPLPTISHCSLDPENRSLIYMHDEVGVESVLFGFVARKKGSNMDNECLIFGQFESDQPSHAIVDFVNKLLSL